MKAKYVSVKAKPPEFMVCNGALHHLPAGQTDPCPGPKLFPLPGRHSSSFRAWLKCCSWALCHRLWGLGFCYTCLASLWTGSSLRAGGHSFLSLHKPDRSSIKSRELSKSELGTQALQAKQSGAFEHFHSSKPRINNSRPSPLTLANQGEIQHQRAAVKSSPLLPRAVGVGEQWRGCSSYLQPPQRIRRVCVTVEKPGCLCPCA